MKNRPGEKIKLASIDELLGVVNEECRTGKIGGTHVYFKTCWEDIITAGMADPFCDRPRACLKKAFCKMCVTICGRFCPDEGAVAGYGN